MKLNRYFLHPIFDYKKGVLIFCANLLIGLLFGFVFYADIRQAFLMHHTDFAAVSMSIKGWRSFFFSPFVQIGFMVFVALVATAFSLSKTRGSIERVEEWLKYVDAGGKPQELIVRQNDKYKYFVILLNALAKRLK